MSSSIRGAYTTYCGLAAALGAVHGDVGRAQQLVRVVSDGDADARGDEHLAPLEVERRLQVRDHTLGGVDGRGDLHVLDQDRELVPTEAGDRVARRARVPEALPDGPQQRVAGQVTQRVVDRLEVVQVEEEHGRLAARAPADERVLDAIGEQRPVGEPGERIVKRLMPQELLRLAACRDVEQVALQDLLATFGLGDHPRLVVHPDRATVPRDQPVVQVQRLAGDMGRRVRGEHRLPVVGVQDGDEERRVETHSSLV